MFVSKEMLYYYIWSSKYCPPTSLFKPFQLVTSHEIRTITAPLRLRVINVSDNPIDILSLFHSYGYLIIFFGIMLDNAGLPVPGELFLLLAGSLAASGMDLAPSLLTAVAGAVIGDSLAYLIGRWGGRRLIDTYINCTLCTCNCADKAESFFKRFGYVTIPMARFVFGVRTLSAPLTGALRVGYIKFLALDLVGAALWAATFLLLGFIFRETILDLLPFFEKIRYGFVVFVLSAIAAIVVFKLIRRRISGKPDLSGTIQRLRFMLRSKNKQG